MPSVTIDCFHEHLPPVAREATVVAMDVIRATTTAITAVATGSACYPAGSIEAAVQARGGPRPPDPGGRARRRAALWLRPAEQPL